MALLIIVACKQQPAYERLVEEELQKEVRYDSLFLGYKFGMSKKDFFQHSWKLNQEHVVKGNAQVIYEFDDLASTAQMVFYPDFHNNRIYRMPAEISYKSWAPWNPELSADSLLVDLVDFYRKKYGDGFIKAKLPDIERMSWVKVDGNRRIAVYPEDNRKVRVEFLDLTTQQMLDNKQDK
ncbi:hypothetical protein [Fodinibius salsisoli]|uniref:Outer membrane lipoprotein-sorting protein n=1 Tax=Fodinibius salsisoli TaxID=2820877 RepID=A0ABT3PKR4_9BACT|nr:hypothetical protein [Fodinibius salsisoli]MCW9706499.1 hypothetical protein [Fodinibius salsisoli]